ncbi:MAG: DegT/DnrJ/EryC1/StrS family aminotransferase [Chitinophagaceae bacterium]
MINVTKTYLPPFEEYAAVIKRAWDKGQITNNGELVQELEQKLKDYLGVKYLLFCNNGTIVLQMALKALEIKGEVLTTPFSYVATTNAILWENCKPVFVDINQNTFNINADKIEASITENTQALLATHVYGISCDIEKIESIAVKYNLKVIYDGAHAFGCTYKNKSLLSYGDISTCSFHATKLFHTVEGGCVICADEIIYKKLYLFRQFGHIYDDYFSVGINAKNSEFHAAMGLCVLQTLPELINLRKQMFFWYNAELQTLHLESPVYDRSTYNFSYYPVLFNSEKELLSVKNDLQVKGINARRYFYPSLNKLPFLNQQICPVSEDISERVLCLPLFHDLEHHEIILISSIIKDSLSKIK